VIQSGTLSFCGLDQPSVPCLASATYLPIALALPDLLAAGQRLNGLGTSTHSFLGEETTEPSVIGWMPSAQLYFSDPDGHSLEYITVLDETPDAGLIGSFSAW
jgi:lactoylglutathione lyase